jgi:foldase protein PrsA
MKQVKQLFLKLKKKVQAIPRKIIFLILILIILVSSGYLFKNQLVVAMVNGRPISRLALIKELERQGKTQVLENLITKTLILQEAEKQKITVSEEEINAEIAKIEEGLKSSEQNLDQLLQLQGMTRDDLKEQYRLQKKAEKLAGTDIEVTEEEIKNYQEENKDYLPKDKTAEEIKAMVTEQLKSDKLNQKIQEVIQGLRDQANIKYL